MASESSVPSAHAVDAASTDPAGATAPRNVAVISDRRCSVVTTADLQEEPATVMAVLMNKVSVFPPEIPSHSLDQLASLSVSTTSFDALPSSGVLERMPALRQLVLDNDPDASSLDFTAVAPRLQHLQELTVHRWRIRDGLSFLTHLTSLTRLSLSHNQLKELPDALGSLVSLQELEVSHNELTTLPSSLRSLSSLRNLNLCANRLQTASFPAELHTLASHLQHVDLTLNFDLSRVPDCFAAIASHVKLSDIGVAPRNDAFRTVSTDASSVGDSSAAAAVLPVTSSVPARDAAIVVAAAVPVAAGTEAPVTSKAEVFGFVFLDAA